MIARARPVLAPADALRLVLCAAALLLAIWLGVRACEPPAALAANAPPRLFSAERAMADVRAIGQHPHPLGSPEHDRVAAHLIARLAALGLWTMERHYLVDDASAARIADWSRGTLHPSELADVVGLLRGRDPRLPALVLMAHYDTVWGSPGAPDDGAGVASVLEIVRALRARGRPARDVMVLFTDGEETGLAGAKAFWGDAGLADHAGVVLNLESRGAGGRAIMFETGPRNAALIARFAHAAYGAVANSMTAAAYARMPNNTDFSIARDRGLPGLNFANLGRASFYHSPLATPDSLDPRTVQDMGDQALAAAAAIADDAALPIAAGNAAYFDLLGRHLVHYPVGAGWLVVLAATGALLAACARQRPSARAIAAGIGTGLWLLAHAALLLQVLNALSGARPGANYYDRLAALPLLERQAVLAVAACAIAALALRRPRRRWLGAVPGGLLLVLALRLGVTGAFALPTALVAVAAGVAAPRSGAGGWGGWIGLIVLLIALAAATQAAIPGAAWLFAWPALILALAAAAAAWIGPRPATLVVAALAAVVVSAPLIPVAHLAMLGLGASVPAVVLLAAPAMLAAFWPLARMRFGPAQGIAVALCVLLAANTARHVRDDPMATTVPRYSLAR